MSNHVLGIDAGGTGTRWLVLGEDQRVVARGKLGPLSGLSYLASGSDGRITELGEAALGAAGVPKAVVAGVTGLSAGDTAARRIAAELARVLRVDEDSVLVLNDMTLVYRSAFEPGHGVAVYAGTGSVAVHERVTGELERAGGHGYLVDDAGGGYWIGRQALRHVLRQADDLGAPATGPLATAIYGALGTSDWPEIRSRVYSEGRSFVAGLVPAVAAALDERDGAAQEIVGRAGLELARLANTLLCRLGSEMPVSLSGGVTNLGDPLLRAVAEALPPGSRLVPVERESVAVAADLALALARS